VGVGAERSGGSSGISSAPWQLCGESSGPVSTNYGLWDVISSKQFGKNCGKAMTAQAARYPECPHPRATCSGPPPLRSSLWRPARHCEQTSVFAPSPPILFAISLVRNSPGIVVSSPPTPHNTVRAFAGLPFAHSPVARHEARRLYEGAFVHYKEPGKTQNF
jgi:hypothetical protein